MNSLWKIVRNTMAIIGGILLFCAASTSDYYTMELGVSEPDSVWKTIIVALVLMIPMWVELTYKVIKEKDDGC